MARDIGRTINQKHIQHVFDEGAAAGRKVPTATNSQAEEAIASFRTADGPTAPHARNAQRGGFTQGVANEMDANSANIGSLEGKLLSTDAQRRAAASVGGMTQQSMDTLRTEIRNLGRMQDAAAALRDASRGRPEVGDQTVEQGARAIGRWAYAKTAGTASFVKDFLAGMTQQRRREVLNQLTTPDGVQMLIDELGRRETLRNTPISVLRAQIVNVLAQEAGKSTQGGK